MGGTLRANAQVTRDFHYGGSANRIPAVAVPAVAAVPLFEIQDLHVSVEGQEILTGVDLFVFRARCTP